MKYSYKYIEERIDKRFEGISDPAKALSIHKENRGLHNQNRIVLDFLDSDFYKDYNRYEEFHNNFQGLERSEKATFTEKVFEKIRLEYVELDKRLSKIAPEDLKLKDLEPYLELLPEHLDAEIAPNQIQNYQKIGSVFCRHGANRLQYGLDKDTVEYVLKNIDTVEKITTGKLRNSSNLNLKWHKVLATCWILIEGGVGEVSLYIAEVLSKVEDVHNIIPEVLRSGIVRNDISLLWIKASAHIQLKNKDQAKKDIQKIVKYHTICDSQSYLLSNRVVEASILLYRLDPSEENLQQAKRLLTLPLRHLLWENTETVRERGLIIYDFYQSILKSKK